MDNAATGDAKADPAVTVAIDGETDRATGTPGAQSFSLDSFTRDDRLRLFAFTTADRRVDYLWVLRAFERSRTNYVVQLHAGDVADILRDLAPDAPELASDDLTPLLDQLHLWHLLDRSYDGTRAASLAEYRNRHYVYQFTQAGYRAFRAVEEVLSAGLDDAQLSKLVWPELLADLQDLAVANRSGNAEKVYRTLRRLDATLSDMADRAAQFYLMLSDMERTNDASTETFMTNKDALLVHMQEFSSELARYGPRLAAAVAEVEATGVEQLVEHAAEADERVFASPAERFAHWHQSWAGVVGWFTDTQISGTYVTETHATGVQASEAQSGDVAVHDRPSEATRLQDRTVTAIGALLASLRRITEARRGGVSMHSQLRHLAGWFTAAGSPQAAHALFDVTFGLGTPRHVSTAYPDPELIPARRSWWETSPVEVSRTLVETGKTATPGPPARVGRDPAAERRLRDRQLDRRRDRHAAATGLKEAGIAGRELTEAETALLFDLLDTALAARVPVSGRSPAAAGSDGVRLTLTPADTSSTVRTVRGSLHLDRMAVTIA